MYVSYMGSPLELPHTPGAFVTEMKRGTRCHPPPELLESPVGHERHPGDELRLVVLVQIPVVIGAHARRGETHFDRPRGDPKIDIEERLRPEWRYRKKESRKGCRGEYTRTNAQAARKGLRALTSRRGLVREAWRP